MNLQTFSDFPGFQIKERKLKVTNPLWTFQSSRSIIISVILRIRIADFMIICIIADYPYPSPVYIHVYIFIYDEVTFADYSYPLPVYFIKCWVIGNDKIFIFETHLQVLSIALCSLNHHTSFVIIIIVTDFHTNRLFHQDLDLWWNSTHYHI